MFIVALGWLCFQHAHDSLVSPVLAEPKAILTGNAEEQVDFDRQVRPIFERHCTSCHGADKNEGGLRLHRGELALAGSDSGKTIVPGNAAASQLAARIASDDEFEQMPPEGERLSAEQIRIVRRWIDQGASWPERAENASSGSRHWAFQPIVQPAVPHVNREDWPRTPVDRFILARLEAEGLSPSDELDRARLIRRVTFDLTGLPPTLDEVEAYVQDEDPMAYERLVDRLLASPAYGEHWASLWLDLARYADTRGYENDLRRTIWPYRDWVIDAINRDLPYDAFTVEQLAGDLLPEPTLAQRVATAFHRNTLANDEGGTDDEEFRSAAVVDRVNTTMQVWMGLTVGCCQCHSHKHDPFTQQEYYELYAFFNQTADADRGDETPTMPVPLNWLETAHEPLERQPDAKQPNGAQPLPSTDGNLPQLPVMVELADDARRQTTIHIRGSFLNKGREVAAGVPAVLHALPSHAPRNRLGLAQWLIDERNPLTARVAVNRNWERLFGVGLVETSDDFGTQGAPPSHPELLDWLAVEFRRGGWSQKKLHRLLVTSAAYRQQSHVTPELYRRDPYNRLLARGPRVRLTAEQVRDQALAVSGLLSRKMYGPSVMPPQPAGIWAIAFNNDQWVDAKGEDRYRRALYTFLRRTSPYPSLLMFDAGSRENCLIRRAHTNTPLQALVTLNDPVYMEAAQAFARRIVGEAPRGKVIANGNAFDARLEYAFRLALTRTPTQRERKVLDELYRQQLAHYSVDEKAAEQMAASYAGPPSPDTLIRANYAELAAWTVVANVLLNVDEIFYR